MEERASAGQSPSDRGPEPGSQELEAALERDGRPGHAGAGRRAGRGAGRALRRGPAPDRWRRSPPPGRRARTVRDALVEDGVVASLLLVHDLYPVDLEDAGRARRWTRCARTWSPTAATSSCWASRTGVARLRLRGQLHRLPGVVGHAGARDQAGAGRARARPGRLRGRGASAEPEPAGAALPMAGDGSGGAGVPARRWPRGRARLRRRRARRGSRWTGRDGRGARTSLRPLEVEGAALVVANVDGDAAGLPRRVRGLRRTRWTGQPGRRRSSPARRAGVRFDLPAAGRAAAATGLQLEPVPLLRDGRAGVRVAVAR